jgi:hypothetical protein
VTGPCPQSLADWARVRGGTSPKQLAFIASASLQVIEQLYTHLTKDGRLRGHAPRAHGPAAVDGSPRSVPDAAPALAAETSLRNSSLLPDDGQWSRVGPCVRSVLLVDSRTTELMPRGFPSVARGTDLPRNRRGPGHRPEPLHVRDRDPSLLSRGIQSAIPPACRVRGAALELGDRGGSAPDSSSKPGLHGADQSRARATPDRRLGLRPEDGRLSVIAVLPQVIGPWDHSSDWPAG